MLLPHPTKINTDESDFLHTKIIVLTERSTDKTLSVNDREKAKNELQELIAKQGNGSQSQKNTSPGGHALKAEETRKLKSRGDRIL